MTLEEIDKAMRVFYSGFNLHGQFISSPHLIVDRFVDYHYEGATFFELGHTATVVIDKSGAFLHRRLNSKSEGVLKITIDAQNVQQVACTDKRVLFLTKGSLSKLDFDNDGSSPTPLPNILNGESGDRSDYFVRIASGSKITVGVTNEGKIFNLPNQLKFENKRIADIKAGREHCIILDVEGNIFTFGRGSRGQLGHGSLDDELEPKLVQGLAGMKITQIAAGGWHSCAVSHEGDLYAWGWNQNGQLGIGTTEQERVSVMAIPHVVDFQDEGKEIADVKVCRVACGNRHTVALLDNNHLYGTGWNKYHQLGSHKNGENVYNMTYLHNFSTECVDAIKCGPWSTAVVVNVA